MLAMSHPRKLVSVLYKYLYCTVLFRTVLYKKEKICRQRIWKERKNVSKTEVHSTRERPIVSRHQINTCTVLYFSVLYCIKMRKFAQTRQTDRQRTFQKLKSTLRGSWPINTYVLFSTQQYSTILYNTLNYAIVSRHQINTCTVLHSSVLYCIKREG